MDNSNTPPKTVLESRIKYNSVFVYIHPNGHKEDVELINKNNCPLKLNKNCSDCDKFKGLWSPDRYGVIGQRRYEAFCDTKTKEKITTLINNI